MPNNPTASDGNSDISLRQVLGVYKDKATHSDTQPGEPRSSIAE